VSAERDTTRIVRSWLEPGVTDLPDRVLDEVLDRLPATPQRRPVWSARRFTSVNSLFKPLAAAAAIVVASAVGINLLNGSPSPPPGTAPTPTPGVSVLPSVAPGGSSVPVSYSTMRAGRYHFVAPVHGYAADGAVRPVGHANVRFEAPDGWTGIGWGIYKDPRFSGNSVNAPKLQVWNVNTVYLDPCHTDGAAERGDVVQGNQLSTLDGLAEALSSSEGFAPNSPSTTGPVTTTLGGLDARAVEIHVPRDLDVRECQPVLYSLFADPSGGDRYVQGAGELERLWVVDADGPDSSLPGGLLIINAVTGPETPAAEVAELNAMLETLEVEFFPSPPQP
jgi:hypothetical protein